jgi:hypothetical protein
LAISALVAGGAGLIFGFGLGAKGLGGVSTASRELSKGLDMEKLNLANSSFMAGFAESYLADLGRIVAAWPYRAD